MKPAYTYAFICTFTDMHIYINPQILMKHVEVTIPKPFIGLARGCSFTVLTMGLYPICIMSYCMYKYVTISQRCYIQITFRVVDDLTFSRILPFWLFENSSIGFGWPIWPKVAQGWNTGYVHIFCPLCLMIFSKIIYGWTQLPAAIYSLDSSFLVISALFY